jgi:hypothetical protein
VVQEGKPSAETGRNTQTNNTQKNPVKLLKVSDLRVHRARPSGMYFEPNNGRWAPLGISNGTEATALSSKSIRLHLVPLNREFFYY